jgi:fermentation-respiration switch protein FrsA (DUF1100 family)
LPPFAEDIVRRNVELATPDGVPLRGWLLDVPDERLTLVYFYGNGQSVMDTAHDLYTLADRLRVDVLCVDYRGYGFSAGTPTLAALGEDGLRVFDHAVARAGGRGVVVMGYSLGTGVAVLVGARREAAGIILVAPPASPGAMVEHMESRLPWYARLLVDLRPGPELRRLDPTPEDAIRQVREPLLVVHGDADDVVPFSHGRRLFERAASPKKRFCPIPKEDHAMALFAVEPYRDCVISFLDSL